MTAWKRFYRNRLAVVGLALIVVLALSAALAPWLAPYDPARQSLVEKRSKPGAKYWLGADEFGRDIFSRVIYGSRIALLVGVVSVLIALAGGLVLGTISGFAGGWLDAIMMRGIEILLAFPYLLLALAIVAAMGTGALNTTIAVGVWGIPTVTRMVRGSVLALRETEYVGAARALGAATPALLRRHIMPNIVPGLTVYATLFMANAILLEAALSFLGLGVQPPTASWGLMVSTGRDVLLVAPHVATVPGLAIMLAVLAFNLVGDGLRGALIDGTGRTPGRDATVVITDGRVETVTTGSAATWPSSAEVIDVAGMTVLPGLIDCHDHLAFHGYELASRWELNEPGSTRHVRTARVIERTLGMGYTTIRDAGGLDAGFRAAVEEGLMRGPRLLSAVAIISPIGGIGDRVSPSGPECLVPPDPALPRGVANGVDGVRRGVRRMIRSGGGEF